MYGFKSLCKILNDTFEISHEILNQYIVKMYFTDFYFSMWFMIFWICDVINPKDTELWAANREIMEQ